MVVLRLDARFCYYVNNETHTELSQIVFNILKSVRPQSRDDGPGTEAHQVQKLTRCLAGGKTGKTRT